MKVAQTTTENSTAILHLRFQSLRSVRSRVGLRSPEGSTRTRDARCATAREAISAGDSTQLFNERFPLLAIVDHERVIFAMCGPRAARDFAEIYKLPVGHVCFLES